MRIFTPTPNPSPALQGRGFSWGMISRTKRMNLTTGWDEVKYMNGVKVYGRTFSQFT